MIIPIGKCPKCEAVVQRAQFDEIEIGASLGGHGKPIYRGMLAQTLKRADLTYDDLADRLKKHGFKETKASIANKLARATMSAHFFLASLAAMGREAVALEDI